MKKYTKPQIHKVTLNHEQAVLGTCSAGVTSISMAVMNYCRPGDCKQRLYAFGRDWAANS
ncbi:MAG: hypothetical protein MUP98_09675 [Candidatus Aminicenantes bacterium]|nr:hypothetical protein [Candidatus Aminicenantes bacterium]